MTRKVKIKKKKVRIKSLLIFLVVLILIIISAKIVLSTKTKNIIISGNELLSDQTIIEEANLTNYPEFFKTSTRKMKIKLKSNPYIKNVKIERKFFNTFKISSHTFCSALTSCKQTISAFSFSSHFNTFNFVAALKPFKL